MRGGFSLTPELKWRLTCFRQSERTRSSPLRLPVKHHLPLLTERPPVTTSDSATQYTTV